MPPSNSIDSARITPLAAVNAIIVDSTQKVLLTRRSAAIREPGKWCLPGGHLEIGESWEIAMAREVGEETGLRVLNSRLVGIYSDPELTVTSEPLSDGLRGQFLCATFLVTEYEGEVRPNEEVDEWLWFDGSVLPNPILKSHPIRIRDALTFLRPGKHEVFVR